MVQPWVLLAATRVALLIAFVLFILLCGLLLPVYLRNQQQEELNRIKRVYTTIANTLAFSQAEQASEAFSLRNYLAPVLFTAFVVLIFSAIALFGSAVDPDKGDYIMIGNNFAPGVGQTVDAYTKGTLSIIVFAFFGVYIWSVQYILARIVTRDIKPGEFYRISINIIFGVILAIAVRHVVAIIFPGLNIWLPAIGFVIGMAPNIFMEWLTENVLSRLMSRSDRADPLRLDQIEGLSASAIFRLVGLDIQNAQNLAYANPVTLFMCTRFGLSQTVDWVAQAMLLTRFKFDATVKLRAHQIRTILDFDEQMQAMRNGGGVLKDIAAELGATPDALLVLAGMIEQDAAFVRLKQLSDALGRQEINAPAAGATISMVPSEAAA